MSKKNLSGERAIDPQFVIDQGALMREVLTHIDVNGEGVAVVIGPARRFMGIITDGDIRRAILSNDDFEQTAAEFLAGKSGPGPEKPLTASTATPRRKLIEIMDRARVRHIPLLDDGGRVAGLALMSELERDTAPPLRAVVMAGGFGQRLRPLTQNTPKPLLTIGNKPVIERTVEQLRDAGIKNISITTHFQADKIKDHFGDGSDFGVNVQYTHENEPMGTAGALSMLENVDEPLLVINGDILTEVDFRAMQAFHREHDSDLTVAVRKYEIPVPFGVIKAEGVRVTQLVEKPVLSHFINAGIYLLEPSVLEDVPATGRLDMTDLIEILLKRNAVVTSFPIHEYWLDIGQVSDYIQAQQDVGSGKFKK